MRKLRTEVMMTRRGGAMAVDRLMTGYCVLRLMKAWSNSLGGRV